MLHRAKNVMLPRPSRRMRVAAVAGMPSKVQVLCTFRGLRRVKHLCLRLFSVGASREQAEWPEGRKACSRPYVAEHLQPHDSLASDSSGPVAAAPSTSERRARCAASLLLALQRHFLTDERAGNERDHGERRPALPCPREPLSLGCTPAKAPCSRAQASLSAESAQFARK